MSKPDIAEFFVSLNGVGMFVLSNARSFKLSQAVVSVFALMLLGLMFDLIITQFMLRYVPWYRRETHGD
ncbi:MAG: hypothetical protein OSB67_02670 [Alphaproteobacteria bacterium]|nr:hypothetical protein [Alphaproteobacteria bacterium]